jgi:2-amino-4-hydroxy-6-hydroxymethyldihydropteridine diphosphokinase
MTIWRPAYVGLGSNLDDPRERVRVALAALGSLRDTRLLLASPLYGSTPMGPIEQPDFVNAVAGLITRLDAQTLFAELQGLEAALGREPARERWGPRRIDLDLLVFSHTQCKSDGLELPHPGIGLRNWVLVPLADIAPELYIPGLGRAAELARRASQDGLWPLSA